MLPQSNARSRSLFARTLTFGALTLGVSTLSLQAQAMDPNTLPSGGHVVGGSASFDYTSPGQLHVHQGTDRAIINWDSFNIGRDALTQFYQPSASSIAVNRVVGEGMDPTQILGSLQANGTVMVLDRNGVIFGADSQVDVGSIVVSTGNIDDAAFMAGDGSLHITGADTGGRIVNQGSITVAEAGLAAFVSPTLINSGVIQARMGRVMLASGNAATLDLYGDGLIEVAVDQKLEHALIDNTGTIAAEGGTVLLSASAAKDVVDTVINTSGVINASSATVKGGKIILEGANTKVSGTIDASGKTGGGEILIGGDYLGGGTTKTANRTDITDTAVIKANTTGADGDGGKVIVWADDSTQFDGSIEATGGSASGNGGFVETSGKINLGVTGSVNAAASNESGKAGEWLLDPQNVRITNGGANSVPGGGGTYDPTGADDPYTISAASISAALSAGNNVLITTTNAGQAQAGNISVNNATILKNNGNSATLTLKADGDIVIDGGSSIRSTHNALNLILWAGANNGGNAQVVISNAQIETNGGEVFIGGGADDGHDINDALGNLLYNGTAGDGRPDYFVSSASGHGINLQSAASINTAGGAFTGLGKAGNAGTQWAFGIRMNNASITSSTGNILMIGEGGTTSAQTAHGIAFEASSSLTSSDTGTITLSGIGGAGSGSVGVSVNGGVINVKDGALTIVGRGGTGGASHHGVSINGNIVSTGNSTITLTGQRTTSGQDIATLNAFTIGGINALGNIILNNDSLSMSPTFTIRTAGSITVKPRTASSAISIGGSATGLVLIDAFMSRFMPGTKLIIGDAVNGTGDIIIDSWDLTGTTYAVELYGNDITIQDTIGPAGYGLRLGAGDFMAYAKDNDPGDQADILVNAAITRTASGTALLDLRADQNIIFTNASVTASNGSLNIALNADRDADQSGAITLTNSAIDTNNGWFVAGGGAGRLWGVDGIKGTADDTASTGADNVAAWGTTAKGVDIQAGSTIATGTGDIIINGRGANAATSTNEGVYIGATLTNSGTGLIRVTGTGGGSGTSAGNNGVNIAAALNSGSGGIKLTGQGAAVGAGTGTNYGITSTADIISANGIIDLHGTGGTGGTGNRGIRIQSGDIRSGNAAINLTGISGVGTTEDFFISAGTIGGIGQSGTITFNADTFRNTGTTVTTTGTILVKPRTASRAINLGGTTGGLDISDTALAYFNAGTLIIGDSVNGTGDIVVESWNLNGKTHHVELYGNDISIQDTAGAAGYGLRLGTGNFLAYAKDNNPGDKALLAVNAAITRTVTGTALLDLRSDRNINFSGGNITSTNGRLNVALNADRDADNDGAIYMTNSTISTNNGWFVAGGGNGTIDSDGNGILGDGGNGADVVSTWGNTDTAIGINLNNTNINTGSSDIHLTGRGANLTTNSNLGVYINGTLETGSGIIDIHGTAAGSGVSTANYGAQVGSSGTVKTDNGEIKITGVNLSTGSGNGAYGIFNQGNILTNGAAITLHATASNPSGGNNHGFRMNGGQINSGASTITITGIGSTGGEDYSINGGTIGGTTAGSVVQSGMITLNANSMNNGGTAITTTGTIRVTPRTASTNINLGNTSTGLNIDDAELSRFTAGRLIIGDAVNGTGDVVVESWDLSAQNHHVELYGNDITIQDVGGAGYGMLMGAGNFLAVAKDRPTDTGTININAGMTKSGAGHSTLTFRADQDVVTNTTGTITATAGNFDVIMHSDANNDGEGRISVAKNIVTNGGDIILGGGLDDGANGGVANDGRPDGFTRTASSNGVFIGATLNAQGGHILARGTGYSRGISVSGNNIELRTSGTGTIRLYGTANGLNTNNYTHGVNINGGNGLVGIYTDQGEILLDGHAQNGLLSTYGTVVESNTGTNPIIQSTSGKITLTGTGASPQGMNSGIRVGFSDAPTIQSTSGTLEFIADHMVFATNANITTSGNVILRPITHSANIGLGTGVQALQLNAATLGAINAGTLIIGDATNGTGDVTINGWNLSAKSHNVQIHGRNITVGGLSTGTGNVYLYAKDGSITVNGDNNSNSSGDLNFLAGRDIYVNEDVVNAAAGAINMFAGWDSTTGITTNALFNLDDVKLGAVARNLILGANGRISSNGNGGTPVLLVASDNFVNNASAGANAVATPNGRYLVYADQMGDTIKGGLTGSNLYSLDYNTAPVSGIAGTDSHFIFRSAAPPPSPPPTTTGTNASGGLNINPTIHYVSNIVEKNTDAGGTADNKKAKDVIAEAAGDDGGGGNITCLVQASDSGSCIVN